MVTREEEKGPFKPAGVEFWPFGVRFSNLAKRTRQMPTGSTHLAEKNLGERENLLVDGSEKEMQSEKTREYPEGFP